MSDIVTRNKTERIGKFQYYLKRYDPFDAGAAYVDDDGVERIYTPESIWVYPSAAASGADGWMLD